MTNPKVTVLIDTYNHEKFISDAIGSVLTQDYPASNVEIIVVDDGSIDRTPEIIQTFTPGVRYIRKVNGGQASAFNVGIRESHGEIIALLDGDDWWERSKLSRIIEHFDRNQEIGVVGHGIFQVDTLENRILRTVPPGTEDIDFESGAGAARFREMMCFFGTSRLAIRSQVAKAVLPIPEAIVIEADEYLAIMSIVRSKASLLHEPLTFYRLHADNLYQTKDTDSAKLRRLSSAISALAESLSTRLFEAGIGLQQRRWLVQPLQLQATKLRLNVDGGKPWETFAAERAERSVNYSSRSLPYRLFEALSLGLTLLMPPRRYYQLRRWYGNSRLRQARKLIGEPTPSSSISSELYQGNFEKSK
jgi:glycosyltransferase involved in cell wall biosynthesis